jgi:hypothetical protein
MEPMISAKIAPIMTGETAFPLRCSDSYPYVNLQSVSYRHRLQSRITLTVLKKVRSFFIAQIGGTRKNAESAL